MEGVIREDGLLFQRDLKNKGENRVTLEKRKPLAAGSALGCAHRCAGPGQKQSTEHLGKEEPGAHLRSSGGTRARDPNLSINKSVNFLT